MASWIFVPHLITDLIHLRNLDKMMGLIDKDGSIKSEPLQGGSGQDGFEQDRT